MSFPYQLGNLSRLVRNLEDICQDSTIDSNQLFALTTAATEASLVLTEAMFKFYQVEVKDCADAMPRAAFPQSQTAGTAPF